MQTSIDLSRQGPAGIITISNPSLKNALNVSMAKQLLEICDEVDADASIGSAVILGAHGTFCSGADTSTWKDNFSAPLKDDAYNEIETMYSTFLRFGELKVPTIAAVRGAVVGAGLNLALAADLRIASHDSRFLAGFLAAGVHPGGGFFTLAARVGGREAAAALGIFGQEVSGDRAAQLGIAWQAVPDREVEEVAVGLAARIGSDPVLARRVTRSFRIEVAPAQLPLTTALEVERGVQLWTFARASRRADPLTHPKREGDEDA